MDTPEHFIPVAEPVLTGNELAYVSDCVTSGWVSSIGQYVTRFEQDFARFCGVKHGIATSNGTTALHLALVALGIRPGDEVIVPSLSFVATANAVRYVGANPVFADIQSETDLTISAKSIESRITDRTRAIIVMHYAGYACDMPSIMQIAERYGLAVIEDAAHAAGAALEGRSLGTWGRIGCFSFFSNKNMTTGEGGMLVTDDDDLAVLLRNLRSHGMTAMTWERHKGHAWSYDVTALGYNYRLDEIRSAIGRVQLKKLPGNNQRRSQIVAQYHDLLQELSPLITRPFSAHRGTSSYHIFPILLPKGSDRVRFMEHMKSKRMQTSIHYPPIHSFSAYADVDRPGRGLLPLTDDVASREVTLPLYPGLTDANVVLVANAIHEALIPA